MRLFIIINFPLFLNMLHVLLAISLRNFMLGHTGAVEEISERCTISFSNYSCKNRCNICILTFVTLISRYKPEKPYESVKTPLC